MRYMAEKHGEDPDEWGIAGMLHDADYENWPEEHPNRIVAKLRELGEERIAHAISAHYTKWEVPYDTLLSKALIAADIDYAGIDVRESSLEDIFVSLLGEQQANDKAAAA
mgnify:CR=1 FL=1